MVGVETLQTLIRGVAHDSVKVRNTLLPKFFGLDSISVMHLTESCAGDLVLVETAEYKARRADDQNKLSSTLENFVVYSECCR